MVPKSPRTYQKRLLMKEQLVQGKEFAVQLQTLLQRPISDNKSVSADDLILKILTSFTEALSELTFSGSKDSDSEFRRKEKQAVKNKRGCYPRKGKASDSFTRESTTMADGHAWRKYGQKVILNSKYPRCYYRCSQKYDQDCHATKQVQKIKEKPIIYRTTYFGHHVCKCPQKDQMNTSSGEDSKLPSDTSSELDWQDFMADDFSLGSMANSDLHDLDMDDTAKFGDFHSEALEFS